MERGGIAGAGHEQSLDGIGIIWRVVLTVRDARVGHRQLWHVVAIVARHDCVRRLVAVSRLPLN